MLPEQKRHARELHSYYWNRMRVIMSERHRLSMMMLVRSRLVLFVLITRVRNMWKHNRMPKHLEASELTRSLQGWRVAGGRFECCCQLHLCKAGSQSNCLRMCLHPHRCRRSRIHDTLRDAQGTCELPSEIETPGLTPWHQNQDVASKHTQVHVTLRPALGLPRVCLRVHQAAPAPATCVALTARCPAHTLASFHAICLFLDAGAGCDHGAE